MDPKRALVLACATVIEEMLPLMPADMDHQVLDFGLHVNPENLRRMLQEAIDKATEQYNIIILGYGLCSLAVIGLHAAKSTMVVPRVDDCIAIFLGSRSAYRSQAASVPGTYYLTKGWIEAGDTPFSEYERMLERYGAERAKYIIDTMLANYKRLALINTGQYKLDGYREIAKRIAEQFGLQYEEIEGSDSLAKKMIFGPWDNDFVVVEPGEIISQRHFFPVS
jgi:Protein of unknown function (DUF1638)